MLRSRIVAVGLSFVVLVGVGACSSDKKDEVKAQAKDATSTTAGDTSSDIADAAKGAMGVNDECVQAAVAWSSIVVLEGQFMTGAVSDDDRAKFKADLDDLGAKVPSELKDDFDVMAGAFAEWSQAMADVNMSDPSSMTDPATAAKLEAASAKLDTPEAKAAQKHIDDYFSNCGK